MKADLHPLLEIPTIKVRNEFDNTAVEFGPAQGKTVKLGIGYLGFCSVTHQFGNLSWAIQFNDLCIRVLTC